MNRAWFLLLVHHDPACAVSDLGLPERYSSAAPAQHQHPFRWLSGKSTLSGDGRSGGGQL